MELTFINTLAIAAGASKLPFPNAEPLPVDNGERFFSEHLSWMKQERPKTNEEDVC